jgi:hypothetical protein
MDGKLGEYSSGTTAEPAGKFNVALGWLVIIVLSIATLVCLIIISAYAAEIQHGDIQAPPRAHAERNYVPDMGEIMSAIQRRHAKLWFAGNARNWNLARFELDEIEEGFEDAARYHPVYENEVKIPEILDAFMDQAVDDVRKAIVAKDSVKFRTSFDRFTNACNACHLPVNREFIKIKRPTDNFQPFSNQEFLVQMR